jgi:hypothetical protein
MVIQEHKTKNGYKYIVPIEDGTLEYYTKEPIRTKETKKTLDGIFQTIISKPNGEGEINYEGYNIKYKKEISLWL